MKQATPYMLRNDGVLLECGTVHPYLVYDNNRDWRKSLQDLFVGDYAEYEWFQWFYNNTHHNNLKDNLKQLCIEFFVNPKWFIFSSNDREKYKKMIGDFTEKDSIQPTEKEVQALYELCDNDCNQEFCRVRTSALKYGNKDSCIYFRISSVHFNWFDVIWQVAYDNKNQFSEVTICTDTQSKGGLLKYYHIGQIETNHMPINDFINCSGNPIIESSNYSLQCLSKGMTLDESFNTHPIRVNATVKSLWQQQLEKYFV